MLVYGIDFASAPHRNNPITGSHCKLQDDVLIVTDLKPLNDLNEFEVFLNHNGPWIAGIDFPFGQPKKLINNLNWPETWEEYVKHVSSLSKEEFEERLTTYKNTRPYGDREHRRVTDVRAGSLSPMKLYGVPVGKMFFQGAPRLLRSNANIIPCRTIDCDKIVVEAYPGLVARNLIERESYKGRNGNQETKKGARAKIICKLNNKPYKYGIHVKINEDHAEKCIEDRRGDWLDSILCAVQAAWAYSQKNYGVPFDCDINEGWIVDPSTLTN
jgi:hypothetical protein